MNVFAVKFNIYHYWYNESPVVKIVLANTSLEKNDSLNSEITYKYIGCSENILKYMQKRWELMLNVVSQFLYKWCVKFFQNTSMLCVTGYISILLVYQNILKFIINCTDFWNSFIFKSKQMDYKINRHRNIEGMAIHQRDVKNNEYNFRNVWVERAKHAWI